MSGMCMAGAQVRGPLLLSPRCISWELDQNQNQNRQGVHPRHATPVSGVGLTHCTSNGASQLPSQSCLHDCSEGLT